MVAEANKLKQSTIDLGFLSAMNHLQIPVLIQSSKKRIRVATIDLLHYDSKLSQEYNSIADTQQAKELD